MSDCGCNTITTTPCTASTGCLTTNYAKCILYSGPTLSGSIVLPFGTNIDDSIQIIATAVNALTPSDISWATFDYACLATYISAQEFAEGISAAHCALVVRVEDLETPVFSLCSLFTSGAYEITPATTTLQTILEYYGAVLCTLYANDPSNISLSNSCFTVTTGITTMEGYLQWIVDNVCSIRTTLVNRLNTLDGQVAAFQSYLGTTSQLSTRHDNSDCLAGGSTDTAYDTIQLIKSRLCTLNATVSALPDLANVALSWGSCAYGISPNSVTYSNTATSLLTQLGRMVSVLKLTNYQFDSSFTVTHNACGPTISLNTTNAFACGDLISCSIHDLGDVTATADGAGDTGGSLTYDLALGYYRPIKHIIAMTTGGLMSATVGNPRGVEVVTTTSGNAADLSKSFALNFRQDAWLDLSSYIGPYVSPGTTITTPYIMKTWDGQIKFKGSFVSASTYALGVLGQPLNVDLGIALFNSIPALYRPTVLTSVPVPIGYVNTLTSPNVYYLMGQLIFDPATGHVRLYVRDQNYLLTNIDGQSPAGTNEYLGAYAGQLSGVIINE